jgi:hypothetical protein
MINFIQFLEPNPVAHALLDLIFLVWITLLACIVSGKENKK